MLHELSAIGVRFNPIVTMSSFLFIISAQTTHATPFSWTKAKHPSHGEAQSIGAYASGCLQGAATLAAKGEGFKSIRRYRNRYYAHPQTIEVVKKIGREVKDRGLKDIEIGDLSQARGGRMKYGHRSHQSGLDIDIWFGASKNYLETEHKRRSKRIKDNAKERKWSNKKLESALFDVDHPSAIKGSQELIDDQVWSERHEQLLKIAASQVEVARIFVHFRIKEKMCALYHSEQKNAQTVSQEGPLWLRKLRPWFGHHQHFHVRLHCPQGSPHCEPQGPLPDGLGCEGLEWYSNIEERKRKKEAEHKSEAERLRRSKLSSAERRELKRQATERRLAKEKEAQAKRELLMKRCAHLSP